MGGGASRVLCTHGRLDRCASWTCFPSAISVLLILYFIFAHGCLRDYWYAVLCILCGAGRMCPSWFASVFGFLTFINASADFCLISYSQRFPRTQTWKAYNCKYVEGKELVDGFWWLREMSMEPCSFSTFQMWVNWCRPESSPSVSGLKAQSCVFFFLFFI